jgi:UDP-glucose 4-epimerase
VLLVGGAGFIGRNLCETLRRRGHRAIVVDARLPQPTPPDEYGVALVERAALEDLLHRHEVDAVIHLASTMLPSSPAAQFERELTEVLAPSFTLMDACAAAAVDFVLFSSGGTVYGDPGPRRAGETQPLAPKSRYGLAKVMLEDYARLCHRMSGLRSLVLRPSNPYGRHQRLDGSQGLVAVALGRALSGAPLEVWGDGEGVRDYLDVQDLSRAVVDLLERGIVDATFNVGSGTGHSVNEVIYAVQQVSGRALNVMRRPARDTDVRRIVLDTSALSQAVDWRPLPLLDGLQRFYLELTQGHGR